MFLCALARRLLDVVAWLAVVVIRCSRTIRDSIVKKYQNLLIFVTIYFWNIWNQGPHGVWFPRWCLALCAGAPLRCCSGACFLAFDET